MTPVFGYLFLVLCVAHALCIGKLLLTLRSKFKKVNKAGMENVFSKEFRTLLTILVVFSGSYLIRFLCDVVYFPRLYEANKPCPEKEAWQIVDLIIVKQCDSYIFDYIPLASVLLFHYRNFRVRPEPPQIKANP